MTVKMSKLQVYSLGVVASNKPLNKNTIEVTPIEDVPLASGEITSAVTAVDGQVASESGAKENLAIANTSSIKAEWLPVGQANRLTAPDVRRGEQVYIYRFGDTDKYYWNTVRNDLNFRKLETVIFGFSATTKEGVAVNESNTYLFEVSTHKKLIRLHTSQDNGEPFGYDIHINTGDGSITIEDTAGNKFTFDSDAQTCRFENASGSFFDLTKNVFTLVATEAIGMKTTDYSLEATNATIKAETKHVGNIALAGDLSSSAGPSGSGKATVVSMEIQENLQAGSVDVDGTMHAGKVISDASIQAPNV